MTITAEAAAGMAREIITRAALDLPVEAKGGVVYVGPRDGVHCEIPQGGLAAAPISTLFAAVRLAAERTGQLADVVEMERRSLEILIADGPEAAARRVKTSAEAAWDTLRRVEADLAREWGIG
jgi:hypothetical protein